jgi:antirestriction protein ArdC
MISAPKICVGSQIRAGLSGYVAELGSAFLCGDLGLSVPPRPDHACYLASWLKVLKGDNRAIFTAASAAARAAEWLGEQQK